MSDKELRERLEAVVVTAVMAGVDIRLVGAVLSSLGGQLSFHGAEALASHRRELLSRMERPS